MKKLISLLLVFAMLLCYVPMGVFAAEEAYYVAGTAELCGSAWSCDDANNKMTLNAEGLYEKTFADVPAGSHEFKVTDGTWDNSWGKNGGSVNYTFTTEKVQTVTITFNAESKEIKVYLDGVAVEEPVVEQGYYVAGSGTLCGANWDPGYAANKMTLNADGLYEKTFEKVPAGTHEFKITDGSWDNSWGKDGGWDNYSFTTTEETNVTILFNADTKAIEVVLGDVVPGETEPSEPVETEPVETEPVVEEKYYSVAGSDTLCGSGWNPADVNNKMTLNADGLYEKYFINVPAGTHEFKITNGSWSQNWGADGVPDGANISFTTEEVMNVRVTFDDVNLVIAYELIDIEPYYVAGSDSLCGVGWDPGYAENKMYLDADGLYKKTFQNVAAGTHECKITAGSWDTNWGVDGPNGSNYTFTTEEAHDVTITFNPETLEIGHILAEATEPALPPEPVEYDITINVHYYRPDGDYSNWEVHMWNGVESLSATRKFAEETVSYDGKDWKVATYYADASDVWVGFIIKTPSWTKDPDGDRHIDISDVTGGTVNVYAVSGSALNDFVTDKSQATLGAKVTAAIYNYKTSTIQVTLSYPLEDATVDTFQLEGPDGQMTISKIEKLDDKNYILTYEGIIDEMGVYTLYFNEVPCKVTIPNTYSTADFEAEFTYEGDDLGATWSAESTTFRLWAPTAAKVLVNLYTAGNDGEKTASIEMTQDVNGTWVASVAGDLNGTYYTYSVTRKGETVEAVDPYARTTGVNGNRAMVVDLDSTDPAGWENDTYVTQDNYTDAVIWELHVRDFSIDESSGVSAANRGKYLAFTELGTTIPGTEVSTGVSYMVDLGVNYVHLLPVYDINSVDETTGGYNWGYDPKNYNVPEGSYSTDPYNGAVRVTEFKQMVQSLHNQGIGVIMDVVYNHVADAGQFCFNQIVPGYFSRIHDDGSYQSNSGCGNDTASERSMVRKYIVDSVLYWAEEYHIDGFRWDLVGLIDYETINAVMEEVHKVNPDIIFYGEGWEMCSWTTKDEGAYASDPYSKKMTIQPNDHMVNTEAGVFAFFNDTIRNVIHGGVFTATDKGFVCGNLNEGTKTTVTLGYMGNSNWGSNNSSVDTPLQTINYASCHDNYTLFDNFTVDALDLKGLALSAENAASVVEQAADYNRLAAAYYITAQGVPFIHAGEEMLRSKPTVDAENNFVFDHNSYSSGDEINAIKWYTLTRPEVETSYEYYKGLIAFRKAHPALRMTTEAEIQAAMEVLETGSDNIIAIVNNGGNGEDAVILTIINASANAETFTLPEGEWNVYVNKDSAGTDVLDTVSGTVEVESTSAMILVKAEATVIASGTSGTTEWVIKSDGTMVIYGTGENGAGELDPNITGWEKYADQVTSLVVEEGVTGEIYDFTYFDKLVSVSLPEGITEIGKGAFALCTSLEQVNFPESLTCIDSNAFQGCTKLTEVHLPAALKDFGARPFGGCSNLTGIWVDAENPYFTNDAFGVLFNKDMTVLEEAPGALSGNYVIPETVSSIQWAAFDGCTKLTGVEIPDGVTMLDLELFNNCTSLKSITIPASVNHLFTDVFKGCTGLETVIFEGDVPFMHGAFRGLTLTAYYPAGNDTWTEEKLQDCGGNVTWIALGEAKLEAPVVKVSNVASTGKIKLTWNKVDGAAKYEVYRSTDKKTWKLLKTVTGTSLTNTSTEAGELYYYYVVAVDAKGNTSDSSKIVSRRCDLPQPVISLSNVASTGKIKISWNKIEGAVKYEVYRSTDNKTWTLLKAVTGTSLTNTSTEAGTLYYYKVKAIASSSGANSAFSEVKSRRCDLAQPSITSLTIIASTGKIKVKWAAVEGAVKYELYCSTDNENWTKLITTKGTTVNHNSAVAGTRYYYKVKAIASDTSANSAYSVVKSGYCDLARPTLTVSLNSKDKPVLTWNKVEGAVKYEVYRSTDGKTWTKMITTTGTKLTHSSAVSGTTYYYKVRAIASVSSANSAYSTVQSITAG